MSATYLVDGEPVDLDAARAAFEARQLHELAGAVALVELREKRCAAVSAARCDPSTESPRAARST